MPLKALNDLRTRGLICTHHVPPVFRVEVRGELRRVHQVAEHHGELPAFGVRRVESSRWRGSVGSLPCGGGRRLHGRGSCGGWFWGCGRVAAPDQHLPRLVYGQALGLKEFIFQRVQDLIVQLELHLERAVRHPAATVEKVHHLVKYLVEVHHCPSTCASAASVWGSQNVISMSRYSAMAVDSAVRAGSR